MEQRPAKGIILAWFIFVSISNWSITSAEGGAAATKAKAKNKTYKKLHKVSEPVRAESDQLYV